MVVRSIELLIKLNHQALEKRRELPFLLAGLVIEREKKKKKSVKWQNNNIDIYYVFFLCCVSLCSCIVQF